MATPQKEESWRSQWALGFRVATFIVLILGAHSYGVLSFTGETSQWWVQFTRNATLWFTWAACFPVILRLARKYPFQRTIILKSCLVHLFVGAGMAAMSYAIHVAIHDWIFNSANNWNAAALIFEDHLPVLLTRFFMYLTILTICIALDSYQRAYETELHASQLEAQILQAQMESLTMRLDPEFFFQNLRELSVLMRNNLDAADSMVAQMGEYLRMRLDYCKNSDATLREEMELVKCYLEIQKIKGKEIQIDFHVDLKVLDVRIPALLLQSAVEDSMEKFRDSDAIRLTITAHQKDSDLLLTIQDFSSAGGNSAYTRMNRLLGRLNAVYGTSIEANLDVSSGQSVLCLQLPLILEKKLPEEPRSGIYEFKATVENGSESSSYIWKKWAVITGVFTILAGYFTFQRMLILKHSGLTMNWPQQLLGISGWYLWALITPIVLAISSKYPLKKGTWLRNGAIHTVALIGLWLLATIGMAFVQWAGGLGEISYSVVFLQALSSSPLWLDLICYSTIIAVEKALQYNRRFTSGKVKTIRLGARLSRARLEALKMQLHPHFLFNALNSLSELMQEDLKSAEEMISNLEKFLRLTVNDDQMHEILLGQELEYLKCYLAIEEVRYQDRLRVKMQIEEEAMDVAVPSLVLQPLVENAIRHGIAPRTSPGEIEIQAQRKNGSLKLTVKDNGPGFSKRRKEYPARSGLGLSNTRERLVQLYGEQHRFELTNGAEGGFIVTLEIPVTISMQRGGIESR